MYFLVEKRCNAAGEGRKLQPFNESLEGGVVCGPEVRQLDHGPWQHGRLRYIPRTMYAVRGP